MKPCRFFYAAFVFAACVLALPGTAVAATAAAPRINIKQDATALVDGKSTVNFGKVLLGTPAVRTFTVTNSGTASLLLGSLVVDGPQASEFAASPPGAATLAPGASTTFNVTFKALSDPGARKAALHVLSNDGRAYPFDIALTADAITKGPSLCVVMIGPGSPFGQINIGTIVRIGNPIFLVPSYPAPPALPTTAPDNSPVSIFLKNMGSAPLIGIDVNLESSGAALAPGMHIPTSLDPGASTIFNIVLKPTSAGDFTTGVSITSNDPDAGVFRFALRGTAVAATPPTIAADPQSQIVALGAPATFSATVSSSTSFTRQWKKGSSGTFSNIAGATSASYTLPAVKLADAASLYRVRAVSKPGGLASDSAPASLTVVDRKATALNLAGGKTATFTITAASHSLNALSYLWTKDGGALPADSRHAGGTTKTLTISSVTAADAGTYTCTVSSADGSLAGGSNVLTVFTDAPVITPSPLVMDPAIVGGAYSFFIPLDPAHGHASSFTCSPLPAGLKFNSATGEIYGKPAVSKADPYALTVTATNADGTATAPATLQVSPLTPGAAGTYLGILERGPVTGGLGGRLDLTVTAAGVCTGKLTLGAQAPIFLIGTVSASLGSTDVTSSITLPRSGLAPVTIAFVIDTQTGRFSPGTSSVAIGADSSLFEGWRNAWSATTPPAGYKGLYNFGLEVPATTPVDLSIPQGTGYGSFTVPPAGTAFTTAGRLADGDTYTSSSLLGPDGDIAVFTVLPSKGSLVGLLKINLGTGPAFNDNVLTEGTLTWSRPASTSTSASTYKAGFGPLSLTAEGGKYIGPVAPAIVMDKTAGTDNASLAFFDANIGGPPSRADRLVTLTAGTRLSIAAAGSTLTTLNLTPATGAFSGSFILTDNHPFLTGAPQIKRATTFQGLIVPTTNGPRGQGYFLLQQLPVEVYPQPKVLPVLSGAVVVE